MQLKISERPTLAIIESLLESHSIKDAPLLPILIVQDMFVFVFLDALLLIVHTCFKQMRVSYS